MKKKWRSVRLCVGVEVALELIARQGHDIGIIRFTGKIGTDSLSDIPDYFWMWNWMWP